MGFILNAANYRCDICIQPCTQSYLERERKGRTVPSRLRTRVSENYSIVNMVENRQGAEKLDIHPSRALG